MSLGNTYPPPKIANARKERARKIANSKDKNVSVTAGYEPKGKEPFIANVEATEPSEKAEAVVHQNDDEKSTGENVDMTAAGAKDTRYITDANDEGRAQLDKEDDAMKAMAKVGMPYAGGNESVLEPSCNENREDVTAAAQQEMSNTPDEVDDAKMAVDEVRSTCAGGKECGLDNENRGEVTAAAEPATSNKPDAKEDGRAQLAKEVVAESGVEKRDLTFSGGKECAQESSDNESRVDLTAAVRHDANNKSDAEEDEPKTMGNELDVVFEGGETTRKPVTLPVGTNVCSWFRNREAYVNTSAGEVDKLRQKWTMEYGADSKKMKQGWEADGEWYNGKVTNVRQNRYHVKVYSCTFQTPDRDVLDLSHMETKKMLQAYLDVQAYRRQQKQEDLINKTLPVEETGNGEESALDNCNATEDDDDDGNDQDETDEQTLKVP